MAATCGAKTRSGEPCKKSPLNGKERCKLHGGATPKGTQNAKTHGIYAQTLSQVERDQWDDLQLGSVDDELRLCRLRLVRALNAENENGAKPELDEITVKPGIDGKASGEKKYKRRDYVGMVDRLMGRIESLEKARAALIIAAEAAKTADQVPPTPVAVVFGIKDATRHDDDPA